MNWLIFSVVLLNEYQYVLGWYGFRKTWGDVHDGRGVVADVLKETTTTPLVAPELNFTFPSVRFSENEDQLN